MLRRTFEITGIVQGVGFRPAVHRLARSLRLGGFVQNRSASVLLVLEGPVDALDAFDARLPAVLPGQARLESRRKISESDIPPGVSLRPFEIRSSETEDSYEPAFPPDLAICAACASEIFDPGDRRYGYAFTTCTDCGPRYTVIDGMPYDRERTTLGMFPLCEECRKEYEDPEGRRFHAESIACPACGPRLRLADSGGVPLSLEPLPSARRLLAEGSIIAVRGIGGFLLACDALNEQSVKRLRERKQRPSKPLAVMARDLAVVRHYCHLDIEEEKILLSPESPIVILDVRDESRDHLPLDALSPDCDTIGVMLPYSPLHHLLFRPLRSDAIPSFELLVMTSGNRRSEPICLSNEEAVERLGGIADAFLLHDREIRFRADDSVAALHSDRLQVWRQARGFSPRAMHVLYDIPGTALGLGAELKNTIAIGYGNTIIVSPHVGDLETPEAVAGMEKLAAAFPDFLQKAPDRVVVDLHPDMHSTLLGRKISETASIPAYAVQHHHAHALSCMAENGLEECLCLTFDGTGLGTDGSIWGAELLQCTRSAFTRLSTFSPVPLLGGDAAVREPSRQLFARMLSAGIGPGQGLLDRLRIGDEEARVWTQQFRKSLNAPLTHAAGRLFDAFAAWLGVAPVAITYDAQPAVRLEACAKRYRGGTLKSLCFDESEEQGMLMISWDRMFHDLSTVRPLPEEMSSLAFSFHKALVEASVRMAEFGRAKSGLNRICLSGGVFMNRIFSKFLCEELDDRGWEVYTHSQIPPNDGGIAAGQVYFLP